MGDDVGIFWILTPKKTFKNMYNLGVILGMKRRKLRV